MQEVELSQGEAALALALDEPLLQIRTVST